LFAGITEDDEILNHSALEKVADSLELIQNVLVPSLAEVGQVVII
jgi:hypothetical protein